MDADGAAEAEFRFYEPMMEDAAEDDERDFTERFDRNSLVRKRGYVGPELRGSKPGERFQFLRVGYFTPDPDTSETLPVFNRTVGLKDSYKA